MSNPENAQNVTSLPPQEETPKTSRVRTWIATHPRTAKAIGFTAAAATVVTVVGVVRSRKQDSDESLLDHAEDELTLDSPESAA